MDRQRGNTAEVFDYDGDRVCKLFYQRIPCEYVWQEYENARRLFNLGIRVPEPFEVVNCHGRYGIIYEKIYGVPMREQIEKKNIFELFVTAHKKILDISSDLLMSYKDFLFAMIRGENNGEIAEDLAEEIQALPDDKFVLHGDYHPGNVMITADGEVVIIDLLNVCSGTREYDVARTFFLLENENWQDRYLREMGYGREDIEGYLKVIRKARKYE